MFEKTLLELGFLGQLEDLREKRRQRESVHGRLWALQQVTEYYRELTQVEDITVSADARTVRLSTQNLSSYILN